MLIWWTTPYDCRAITGNATTPHANRKWPSYLVDQFGSRVGRNGRGRLWVAKQFGDVSVDPWPDTPMGRMLGDGGDIGGETYAGIVIEDEDLRLLAELPGIVTDYKLRRVEALLTGRRPA